MIAGGVSVGSLSGRIELEDDMSVSLAAITQKLDQFDSKFKGTGQAVAEGAASFLTAEVAFEAIKKAAEFVIDTFEEMTVEGAKINEVGATFDHLTSSAGLLGDTLLGTLKEGTHNTITDFELMKMVNQDLAAGMKLTEDQFSTLSKGAYALAKATGTDVKSAMDTLNDALLTGRTRAVALLTGKIDLTKAENDFADSLNTTADHLTTEEKLQADRLAILKSVGDATQRLGTQQEGLDDIIAQAQTTFKNFYEDLAKAVASSPDVVQAFEAIRDALVTAFGGDSADMISTIVGWVNYVADGVAHYGPIIINWFVEVKDWLTKVYDTVKSQWDGLPSWLKEVALNSALATVGFVAVDKGVAALTDTVDQSLNIVGNFVGSLAAIPNVVNEVTKAIAGMKVWIAVLDFSSIADGAASFKLLGTSALAAIGPLGAVALASAAVFAAYEIGKTKPVSDFFEKVALEAGGMSSAEADAAVATHHLVDAGVEQAKQAADQNEQTDKLAAMMKKLRAELDDTNKSTVDATGDENAHANALRMTAQEAQKLAQIDANIAAVDKDWHTTLLAMDPDLVKLTEHLAANGISIADLAIKYKLTDPEVKALTEDMKAQQKASDDLTKKTKEQTDALDALNKLGTDYEETVARIPSKIEAQAEAFLKMGASADEVAKALGLTRDQVAAVQKAMDAAAKSEQAYNGTLVDTQIKVHTLSGEFITLAEAQARFNAGGSFDVNKGNLDQSAAGIGVSPAFAEAMAAKGYSFAEIVAAWDHPGVPPGPPQGPRIPGFKDGGYGDFGDGTLAMLHGKEIITPIDKVGAMGGDINLNFQVNGTAQDAARQIKDIIMRELKSVRRFPTA